MHKFHAFDAYVFLSFFILFFPVGCSSSKENISDKTITGQIQMVNNEPFAELALRNEDGLFILDCTGEAKETIYNNQGRTAKIYFKSISSNNLNQKVLKVDKVELMPAGSR